MSKKTFRFIIIVFVILLGASFYLILKADKENKSVGETIAETSRNLFPFGGGSRSNEEFPTENNTGNTNEGGNGTTPSDYKQIYKLITVPVSGMIEVSKTTTATVVVDGKETVENITTYELRYVDKVTGNIFDINPESGIATRVTNTTIPNSHEALFTKKGEGVVYRYVGEDNKIETYSASLGVTGPDGLRQITGVYLPKEIDLFMVSPDQQSVFYTYPSSGGVVGVKSDTENKGQVQIFSSDFGEWIGQWVNTRSINLTTKASGYASGYVYTLDTVTRSFNKVLGGITGLTSNTHSDGIHSLVSDGGTGNMDLFFYTNTDKTMVSLGINTLPEKCVWSKTKIVSYCSVPKSIGSGLLPDDWYQGVVVWSDSVWKIDPANTISFLLLDTEKEAGEKLDLVNPLLSEDESKIYFINRYDNSVWLLNI